MYLDRLSGRRTNRVPHSGSDDNIGLINGFYTGNGFGNVDAETRVPSFDGPGKKIFLPVPSSRYKKLNMDAASQGKELSGLWSGSYGPHGLEVLSVDYTPDGLISATKVLGMPLLNYIKPCFNHIANFLFLCLIAGDPNVPSGEFSFRAWRNTESSKIPDDLDTAISGALNESDTISSLNFVKS